MANDYNFCLMNQQIYISSEYPIQKLKATYIVRNSKQYYNIEFTEVDLITD